MAEDAGRCETVSAGKFAGIREINREFFKVGPTRGSEVAIRPMIQWTWNEIPYSTEQGILQTSAFRPEVQGRDASTSNGFQ